MYTVYIVRDEPAPVKQDWEIEEEREWHAQSARAFVEQEAKDAAGRARASEIRGGWFTPTPSTGTSCKCLTENSDACRFECVNCKSKHSIK